MDFIVTNIKVSVTKVNMAINLGKELLRAAKKGDAKRVRELLRDRGREGVDVRFHEEWDVWGPKTALVVACERGEVEVARLLLEHGGETRQELEAALCWAASGGLVDVLKMVMERGADPSVRENTAVRWAAYNGHVNVVKLLLQDKRVNSAAEENYAVSYAAYHGHCDVLEVLLADPRVDGTRAIPSAHPRAVHVLLDDERCGILVNRDLFLKHHEEEVARYEEFVKERDDRKWAALWCMDIIGWEDVMWPFSDRFGKTVFSRGFHSTK